MGTRVAHPVPAKLRAPRLPEVLDRPRLFRLLDREIGSRPIVWIAAPPGAGKTTLSASYLAARRRPSVWYRLDEDDADPATLTHYLGLAAQQAARSGRRFPALMPEQRARLAAFARDFFSELLERMGSRTLVLDNFQLLPESSPTLELLAAGLAEIPPGATVLVLSRREPPPAFAPLVAARSIGRLEPRTLSLTLAEASALARLWRRKERPRLSVRALKAAHEKTRGWLAGLILLFEQSADHQTDHPSATDEPPQVVFDYLAHELVGGFAPEEQEFLTRVAVLPTMRPHIAENLTGYMAAGRFLERLHRGCTFTERRTLAEAVYQFHPLFRDFLLRRLETSTPPEDRRRLVARAAALLAGSGAVEDALGLHRDSGEAEAAAQLILQSAPTLLQQGRHDTVEQAIRRLPGDLIAGSPELGYTLAVAMRQSRPEEVLALLERARSQFIERGDRCGALRALTHQIHSILFTGTDLRPVDPLIDAAETLLPVLLAGPLEGPEEVAMAAQWMQAIAFRRPWDDRLAVLQDRLTQAVEAVPEPDAIAVAAMQVGFLRLWYGDVGLAHDVVQRARRRCLGKPLSPFPRWGLSLAEAICAWCAGEGQRCIDILRPKVFEGDDSRVVLAADVVAPGQLIYGALMVGDLDLARRAADKMRAAFDKGTAGATENTFKAHIAWVALETGDRSEAERYVAASLEACQLTGPFLEAHARIVAAQLAHELRDEAEADRHLAVVHEIAHEMKSPYLDFVGLLIASGFALDRGERKRATEILAEALPVGRRCRLGYGYGLRRAMMSRVLALALEEGIEEPYALDLIRRMHLAPPEPADVAVAWPRRLKIRTLGAFAVSREGRPAHASRKAQRRPWGLLQALIAFGGRQVAPDRLADALWPDADGDAARQALAITLHRLRRLLGCDEAIQAVEGRLTLSGCHCAVDVWAFESLAARAESSADPDEAVAASEKALALYGGTFLPEEMDAPWAASTRERLRARHSKLVLAIVERWRRRGSFEAARAALERAIEIEPMEERFCCELMTEHMRLGREADAQAALGRYRRALRACSGHSAS